jgi:hypothetical protein
MSVVTWHIPSSSPASSPLISVYGGLDSSFIGLLLRSDEIALNGSQGVNK